jgi:putative FmdB family regulatory protein
MPTYEYRCPNGHTFELFQRMSDPPPEECQICAAAPLVKVLYPAAIHFKGSGFYSTDYGRGGRKREAGQDGDSSSSSESSPSEGKSSDDKKKPDKPEKKAAEA